MFSWIDAEREGLGAECSAMNFTGFQSSLGAGEGGGIPQGSHSI